MAIFAVFCTQLCSLSCVSAIEGQYGTVVKCWPDTGETQVFFCLQNKLGDFGPVFCQMGNIHSHKDVIVCKLAFEDFSDQTAEVGRGGGDV